MPAAAKAELKSEPTAPVKDPNIDEITYHPEDGDPVRTKWNGLEFRAYVPTKVSRSHGILVPMPTSHALPDGTVVTKHVDKRIPMVELARGNPKFSVNGEAPAAKREAKSRVPTNPDEYRGYAIGWIAASTASSAMDARWDGEEALRDKCGVNDGDIAYLRPFFEARHDEVKMAS